MKKKCLQIGLVSFILDVLAGKQRLCVCDRHLRYRRVLANKAKDSQPKKKEKAKTPAAPQAAAPEGGIGWGSGIEVARNARAAQEALQRNDYRSAELYATRAANAAPQNTPLWFLLGYSARLGGGLSGFGQRIPAWFEE